MTITEFLEARIAEDERAAYDLMGEREGDRMLAECAAKRVIITYLIGLTADQERDSETYAQFRSVQWIAEQVAAVYKDHPDYQQEWAK